MAAIDDLRSAVAKVVASADNLIAHLPQDHSVDIGAFAASLNAAADRLDAAPHA